MLTPNSYRDEPFAWLSASRAPSSASAATAGGRRSRDTSLRGTITEEAGAGAMADHSEENVPLLSAAVGGGRDYGDQPSEHAMEEETLAEGGEQYEEEEEESSHRSISGTTVNCRVCDATIQLEGRSMQHVVKCGACQEATPIRPAPPGKKYVRCPCNCLLICKASSTRIACPRQNCRRVITLGAQQSGPGTAMQAPTGTCRVTCAHCEDIFMFNTLSNSLAVCPHCRKRSAVGNTYRRSRLVSFGSGLLGFFIAALFLTLYAFFGTYGSLIHAGLIISMIISYGALIFCTYKVLLFGTARISSITAPV